MEQGLSTAYLLYRWYMEDTRLIFLDQQNSRCKEFAHAFLSHVPIPMYREGVCSCNSGLC